MKPAVMFIDEASVLNRMDSLCDDLSKEGSASKRIDALATRLMIGKANEFAKIIEHNSAMTDQLGRRMMWLNVVIAFGSVVAAAQILIQLF